MYGKLTKMTLAFALLASPVILSGCGGSAEVTQAATATPSAAPTASPTPAPELKNFSVKDKTQEYLENFGTSAWNAESSKEIAENIRIKAREDKENTFTYLEIADSIEKNDVQNVKKIFTKIGGVLPASVAARYPDPTPTPDETDAPSGGDTDMTYLEADQEFGSRGLDLAKSYLEKELTQEIKDDISAYFLHSMEFIIKENQSKYKEMATAIQKDDKATVQKLYAELLPLYQGLPDSATAVTATPAPAAAKDEAVHLKGKKTRLRSSSNLIAGSQLWRPQTPGILTLLSTCMMKLETLKNMLLTRLDHTRASL